MVFIHMHRHRVPGLTSRIRGGLKTTNRLSTSFARSNQTGSTATDPLPHSLPQAPEVNMREPMLPRYVRRHTKEMADGVPWTSGVLLPPAVAFTNGTWGARAFW